MALFKTSKKAKEILEQFRRTGIRPNLWARAALAYSLSLEAAADDEQYDSEGAEFQEDTFYGKDKDILLALLRQRVGYNPKSDEIGRLVKLNVERGLRHLENLFLRLNKRGDEFIFQLLDQCSQELKTESTIKPSEIDLLYPGGEIYAAPIRLGRSLKGNNEIVSFVINASGNAPHIAIMGRNGTGKTRTALSLLSTLKDTYPFHLPYLIFDYAKGDIADNESFARKVNASVIRLPDDVIPIAPLELDTRDPYAVQLAARRFRDTICSVVNLGTIQKERCLNLITQLYDVQFEGTPSLQDLVELAEHEYSYNDWKKEDSLLACLREFASFPLFRGGVSKEDMLFRQTHIIDVHPLPEDLRKLSVFLLLDRLYSQIMKLPDSPLDKDGSRQLRLVIVIDEAHHYLPCRQPTLEKIIREVRSKGVSVWLLSQSPDDFDQRQYNFAREMGLAIVFSCYLEKPRMLEALLGGRIDPKRILHLGTGVALTRLPEHEHPLEIQAWEA